MTNLWSFDFGFTTGVTLGFYGPTTPYRLVDAWEVQGGPQGFLEWMQSVDNKMSILDKVIAERFVLNPGEGTRFIPDIVGVPTEGILMALCPAPIHWQLRGDKATVPDSILKLHALWRNGKDTNHDDARDVNDTTKHALAYLRNSNHLPTLRSYFR